MKVAIVGSRNYNNTEKVEQYVQRLPCNAIIVSGGARGVDKIAEHAARARGLKCIIYYPEWKKYGKAAGMIRNAAIIANAEFVAAFWDGKSKGTADSIDRALKSEHIKRVTVYKDTPDDS